MVVEAIHQQLPLLHSTPENPSKLLLRMRILLMLVSFRIVAVV